VIEKKLLKLQKVKDRDVVLYTMARGVVGMKYIHFTCDGVLARLILLATIHLYQIAIQFITMITT
jgi:hypothetical protein